MKKIIFSMILAGSGCVAMAQTDSMYVTGDGVLSTTSDYNAFSTYTAIPPDYMSSYVLRDYPTAADVKWRQENDWWHAYHVVDGVPNHVYYNAAGQTFNVALPVRQSWVPETVVSKTIELFGPVVYDINAVRGTGTTEIYTVRLLENGQLSTVWIDANGNRVMDVHRMETSSENAALGTSGTYQTTTPSSVENMQFDKDTKVKIKVENSDGTETKTKIKNGKVKVKTDD